MNVINQLKGTAFALFISLFLASATFAADIHVITSGAFAEALKTLAPEYERQSPNKVTISYGSSMGAAPDSIPTRLAKGEVFDVLVLAGPALDQFINSGVIASGSKVDLAGSKMAAAVRTSDKVPDLSTVASFKETLLNTSRIAYSASASRSEEHTSELQSH